MSLVRVWTDIGTRKPVPLIAKIVQHKTKTMEIKYLSKCPDKLWRYEVETYEIDSDSVAEWLGTDYETDVGFTEGPDGTYTKYDSDEDYAPNMSDEEETDEDEDLDEEDENEEEFEEEFEEEEEEEEDFSVDE